MLSVSQLAQRMRTSLSVSSARFRHAVAAVTTAETPLVSWGANQNNNLQESNAISWCQQQIRWRSNRSRRGLYDGKDVHTGNKRSHSMKATKRKFKPNVFRKRLYSETLDEMIRFHVTTSALRSIDHMGGLDNYLLKSRHVTEGEGLIAKRRIIKHQKLTAKHEARKAAEAAAAAAAANTTTSEADKDSSADPDGKKQ